MLLQCDGVTKDFGGLRALSDVSFAIARGEILGLVGPNGAGKTTLFNVMTGFYRPNKGRVVFAGRDITGLPPEEICRLGMARTFQIVKPFGKMTVLENVMVGSFLHNINRAACEREAWSILESVGLQAVAHEQAAGMPIGLRKKIEVARALATRPQLLMLDEVFGGLNQGERDSMMDLITLLRDRGITILLIEHIMPVLMTLSDRVVVLHRGTKLAEGTPEQIARNPAVIEAYLGSDYNAAAH